MSQRDDIVAAAVAQLGSGNRIEYWRSALGREPTPAEMKKAWCGIFALSCLHEAGVALDVHWHMSAGFLLQPPHPLKRTHAPLPGDIGYQDQPFQHHFVVESVSGALVHSVDGNQGTPGVRRKTRGMGPALAFYSIESLLGLPSIQTVPPESPERTLQRDLNSIMLAHPSEQAFPLLVVDGIIGPKTKAVLAWARAAGYAQPDPKP